MKTITHEARQIGSTRSSSGTIAMLLTLSWCVQASGEIQANPPRPSAVAAENQAAAPTPQPEVWLCAGDRIAELLRVRSKYSAEL